MIELMWLAGRLQESKDALRGSHEDRRKKRIQEYYYVHGWSYEISSGHD